MNNNFPPREELISAYQPYVEQGVTNPFDIFDKDTKTSRISELDTAYHEGQLEIAKTMSPAERIELDIAQATVFYDAGFTDVDLLDEIAEDWLANTLSDAEDLGDQVVIDKVKTKIDEVKAKIKDIVPGYNISS